MTPAGPRVASIPGTRVNERLSDLGPWALSEEELLDLVLRGRTARERSRRLLQTIGDARALARSTIGEIARSGSLDRARAASVVAAFELGRRAANGRRSNGAVFRTSAEVFRHFEPQFSGLRQEVFAALLLDARHRKLREVHVSRGSLTASIAHPREVFGPAVREAAAAVLLAHNHPSGDPSPSPEDVELTRRLRAAGDLLGIRMLDHVVVGEGAYFSFADQGW